MGFKRENDTSHLRRRARSSFLGSGGEPLQKGLQDCPNSRERRPESVSKTEESQLIWPLALGGAKILTEFLFGLRFVVLRRTLISER